MTYQPKPIDTSNVKLPDSLNELTEKLAEHVHDIWAAKRIEEGWCYGPKRDGDQKKHPDLVSYSELPDSEKEYDRATVNETLKAIVQLGYRIEKES